METKDQILKRKLDQFSETRVPGLQYVVVSADEVLYEYAAGWADVGARQPMQQATTLMAYSMTKTLTAVAALQLVETGRLTLDDDIGLYLPTHPYPSSIKVHQLLSHTSGIPNPIPLRWVHLVEEQPDFDEAATLTRVLLQTPRLKREPGQKFVYSNIGYWLLGKIIETVAGQTYAEYMRDHVIRPLGLGERDLDFVIIDSARHAGGYLGKYSLMNLIKGLITDSKVWGKTEGRWVRVKNHYVNGPAFGGLIGTARAFSHFLQDQLRDRSVLFQPATKTQFFEQQRDSQGRLVPMTLGWHVGKRQGAPYFYKEGGGAGFHSEMRIYPNQALASVVMVNSTEFNSTKFLNYLDPF